MAKARMVQLIPGEGILARERRVCKECPAKELWNDRENTWWEIDEICEPCALRTYYYDQEHWCQKCMYDESIPEDVAVYLIKNYGTRADWDTFRNENDAEFAALCDDDIKDYTICVDRGEANLVYEDYKREAEQANNKIIAEKILRGLFALAKDWLHSQSHAYWEEEDEPLDIERFYQQHDVKFM